LQTVDTKLAIAEGDKPECLSRAQALNFCYFFTARKSPFLQRKGLDKNTVCEGSLKIPGLFFRLGFFEADDAVAIFPLSAFTEQIDSLEALEYCAILFTTAGGGLEAVVL
jgi:hypothetical protein